MASSKEHIMHQLRLFLHQRLFSVAQELLEQVERALPLDGQDLKPGLDFESTISAAPQVGITLADGNQPKAPPVTHEAPLSPNGGASAQDQLLEIKQEATDFIQKQDSVEHFFEDVESSQPERDGVQADFASDSDHRVHPSRNLKVQGSVKEEKVTESREWPHCCGFCGKGFKSNYYIRIHERTHTGERPYHCDICKKSFTQKAYLKRHERTHTDEKPYNCDVCEKSLAHSGSLKIHKRTHTGEKPYLCDVCGKAFNQNGQLKRHKCVLKQKEPQSFDCVEDSFFVGPASVLT